MQWVLALLQLEIINQHRNLFTMARAMLFRGIPNRDRSKSGPIKIRLQRLPWIEVEMEPVPRTFVFPFFDLERPHTFQSRFLTEQQRRVNRFHAERLPVQRFLRKRFRENVVQRDSRPQRILEARLVTSRLLLAKLAPKCRAGY